MPTTFHINATAGDAVDFEFDSDLSWDETHNFDITNRKVEGVGSVSNYIADKPSEYSISGRVTAYQIDPKTLDRQKLKGGRDRLVQLAKRRDLVLVTSELFTGQLGIQSATVSKSADDGYSFRASLKLKVIEFTTTASANVPASRLKRKVTKNAKSAKKGGASAKRTATDGEKKKYNGKSELKALADRRR